MEQWTRPGQVSWEQFTGYAQLFANIILAVRRELGEWNERTFQEMMRWATFLEELTNDVRRLARDSCFFPLKKKKKTKNDRWSPETNCRRSDIWKILRLLLIRDMTIER